MWDLPGPGLEPVSPALAGGFLTTAPPGKSYNVDFSQLMSRFDRYRLQLVYPTVEHRPEKSPARNFANHF